MKAGDLVRYKGATGYVPKVLKIGLITDGPRESRDRHIAVSYEVWWMSEGKTGWWDDYRLEVVR